MIMTAGTRHSRHISLFFLAFILIFSSCSRAPGGGADGGVLTVAGSTSVQPFAEKIAEHYMAAHPGDSINVQGGGSTAGVKAAETGAAQIGMSSRHLKPEEEGLRQFVIAQDGIAVIVHASNPVRSLTREQIAAIFAGEVPSWAVFGGAAHPIHFVTREEGSGTRGAFEEMVMEKKSIAARALVQDSNGAVREIVASDRNALGYISLGLVDRRVRAVAVDGVQPNVGEIHERRYAIVRPFLFLTREEPRGAARAFIDYVLGPEAQRLLTLEGLVAVSP
jgi:phosphate transport system substrate-binding protein